ncbi:MAG: archease [Patescibacteria group bacterium]
MKKYKILSHPAELRLRIYGKTIEELFSNASEAMTNALNSKFKNQKSIRQLADKIKKLEIKSTDVNSLLVDFLSEILAISQINKKIYLVKKLKIDKDKIKLEAEIAGYPVTRFDEDIKAVTYQDVNIRQIANGKKRIWQTDLVFDI